MVADSQPKKIRKIRSRTIVLPIRDIDTDQILPARFLTTTEKKGLGRHLFADWRYHPGGEPKEDFVLNTGRPEDFRILVAGENFGCGSSREHAPWALLHYGFLVVISTDIADIFHANALKNGLLPVVVDEESHNWLLHNPGVELEIDLDLCVVILPDRREISFPIDAFSRECLMKGIDELGYLLEHEEQIEAYEQSGSAP
jgi:3-isopropylmalate/(R)-2-methylmalate dehydratase small subunit